MSNAEAQAGFASINNDGKPDAPAPVVETPPVVEEATPVTATPAPDATPEKTDPEPTKADPFAGYTSEQITALLAKVSDVDRLAKMVDTAHGKIGDLTRQLGELKAPKEAPEALPDVDDDEFSQTYPEFAAYTKKQLARVATAGAKAGLSLEEVGAKIAEAEATLTRKFELQRLSDMHDDWETAISQDGYKVWLATQPAEVQATATTTGSAKELGKIISAYKEFSTGSNRNKSRLEAALTPSGTPRQGTPAPTAADEARAGFAAVMGRT